MSEKGKDTKYKKPFRTYLLNDGFSEYGADKYIDSITTLVDFYIQLLINPHHTSVFDVADAELLYKYYHVLMQDFVFVNTNRSKGKRPGVELIKYIEFIKSLDSAKKVERLQKPAVNTSTSNLTSKKSDNRSIKAKATLQNKKQTIIQQARIVLRPIEEYINEYGLPSVLSFEYNSTFKDVDVFEPQFKTDLNNEAKELEDLICLMKKYNLATPQSIIHQCETAQKQKALRDTVRAFENWIVGYMAYLNSGSLDVDYINYSPDDGFKICLSGQNQSPILVKMRTSFINNKE